VTGPDIPFLRQLGPRDADSFVRLLRRRAIKRGQPILRFGAAGDDVIVVLEGLRGGGPRGGVGDARPGRADR
jgi:hypothetical protein